MIPQELMNMRPLRGEERFQRDSEYLGADDIDPGTEPVLTIKNIYRGKVTLSRGKEVKNVLTFVEETVPGIKEVRPLIVNSTNRQVLKKLYKQVTANALEGKQVQLYIEHGVRNPAKNELTDGIRIRDKKPAAQKTAATKVPDTPAPKCESCGKAIAGTNGLTPEAVAKMTREKYGKALCVECGAKAKAEMADQAEAVKTEQAQEEPQDDLAAKLLAE